MILPDEHLWCFLQLNFKRIRWKSSNTGFLYVIWYGNKCISSKPLDLTLISSYLLEVWCTNLKMTSLHFRIKYVSLPERFQWSCSWWSPCVQEHQWWSHSTLRSQTSTERCRWWYHAHARPSVCPAPRRTWRSPCPSVVDITGYRYIYIYIKPGYARDFYRICCG